MMSGLVNHDFEAILPLVVRNQAGSEHAVEAAIDTGFNGFLTLPPGLIAELGLPWKRREEAVLADGSVDLFDVYRAEVLWDGQWKPVDVNAVSTQPLVGMRLMHNYELRIRVKPQGPIDLTAS